MRRKVGIRGLKKSQISQNVYKSGLEFIQNPILVVETVQMESIYRDMTPIFLSIIREI